MSHSPLELSIRTTDYFSLMSLYSFKLSAAAGGWLSTAKEKKCRIGCLLKMKVGDLDLSPFQVVRFMRKRFCKKFG